MKTLRKLQSTSALAALCLAGAAISPVHAQNGTAGGTGTTAGTGTAGGAAATGAIGSTAGTGTGATGGNMGGMMGNSSTGSLGGGQMAGSASAMSGMNSGAALTASQRADFDRLFYVKAAKGNMAEIMTSQLAVQKARNPQVKQIAQQMVTEHSRA
jgi:putative membrane protein